MKVAHIPFQKTGYFSKIVCDYLDKKDQLSGFYENFPDLEGFKKQIKLKSKFEANKREVLVKSLQNQYNSLETTDITTANIKSLITENTFTITTGHQLNIFTGPLYFLYKIVSTLNLTKQLKLEFPSYNFVPVYWMATEDHDFEEINYFNLNGQKIKWNRESEGAVGRLKTDGFEEVFNEFSSLIGNSKDANYLKELFKNAYLETSNLTEATRYLVNELFGKYGLVIIDGDDIQLKGQFAPIVKDELLNNTSYKEVIKTNEELNKNYKIQVNPREINLFYLTDNLRERIVLKDNKYLINNTKLSFSESEVIDELNDFPERFSPNVIMRPLYQETILPNLGYIGGGGELAYWFQLKNYFDKVNAVFPILLLRNSVLLASTRQLEKLKKLNISLEEIFCKQGMLIDKKVKETSEINIDFSSQRTFLTQQFDVLENVATKTDASFIGAVKAQKKKQLKGLDNLEKRLLKAEKRKLVDEVNRMKIVQDELFPKNSLEERTRNFSEFYLKLGEDLIPLLINSLKPLQLEFSIVEY